MTNKRTHRLALSALTALTALSIPPVPQSGFRVPPSEDDIRSALMRFDDPSTRPRVVRKIRP